MKPHSLFADSLWPSIDLLYDYAPFLKQSMVVGHIGFFPQELLLRGLLL